MTTQDHLYRIALFAYFVYGLAWTQIEGNFRAVVALGTGASVLLAWTAWRALAQRGAIDTRLRAVIGSTGVGGVFGALAPWLTLVAMGIKLALHNHGPEYAPADVLAVVEAVPLAAAVGALLGLAAGALQTLPRSESEIRA